MNLGYSFFFGFCALGIYDIAYAKSDLRHSSTSRIPLAFADSEAQVNHMSATQDEDLCSDIDASEYINSHGLKIIAGKEPTVICDIRKAIESLEIGNIPVSSLFELRDKITRIYISRGFVNSGAILRRSDNGYIIQIVEGRLSDEVEVNFYKRGAVAFKDEPFEERPWMPTRLRRSYVTSRVVPDKDEILNQKKLQERFQKLSNDPAIYKINASLRPGENLGKAVLELDVYEAKPYWASLSFASDRTPSIGGERISIQGGVRNLLGYADVLSFDVGVTEGLEDIVLDYEVPIGNSPFSLNLYGQYSDAKIVEEPLTNLNVLSNSSIYGGRFFFKRDKLSLYCKNPNLDVLDCDKDTLTVLRAYNISAGISHKRSQSELLGIPFSFTLGAINGKTDNVVGDVSIGYLVQRQSEIIGLRATANVGIDTLDTVNPNAPPENFVSGRIQFQYARKLFDDHQFITRLEGQYSPHSLYTIERFGFGGIDSVRGYRKSDVLADNAIVGSIEYRVGLSPLTKHVQTRFFDDWTMSVFSDFGEGWNSKLPDPINNSRASVGVQLNFQFGERVSGELYYGYKLNDIKAPADQKLQDKGVGFRLTMKGI